MPVIAVSVILSRQKWKVYGKSSARVHLILRCSFWLKAYSCAQHYTHRSPHAEPAMTFNLVFAQFKEAAAAAIARLQQQAVPAEPPPLQQRVDPPRQSRPTQGQGKVR